MTCSENEVINWLKFRWEQYEASIEYELKWQIIGEMGPMSLWRRVFCVALVGIQYLTDWCLKLPYGQVVITTRLRGTEPILFLYCKVNPWSTLVIGNSLVNCHVFTIHWLQHFIITTRKWINHKSNTVVFFVEINQYITVTTHEHHDKNHRHFYGFLNSLFELTKN